MNTPESWDGDAQVQALLTAMKAALPSLSELLARVDDHWGAEDGIYRYYHHSYKVFRLQDLTTEIVEALEAIAPGRSLNPKFVEIVRHGTGKTFSIEDNRRWSEVTRPIVEAFFHARFFLQMAVRYGHESGTRRVLCRAVGLSSFTSMACVSRRSGHRSGTSRPGPSQELLQIPGVDPDGVQHAEVGQPTLLAEPVNGCRADGIRMPWVRTRGFATG
jgi:hypothetical protein